MLWLCDQLSDHCLNDGNVSVEQSAQGTPQEGDPEAGGKAHHDHAEHGADAPDEQDRLSSNSVGQTAPEHAHQGFRKGERRDEQAGIEGGVIFVANLESLYQSPCIWEDGRKSYRLGEANDSYRKGQYLLQKVGLLGGEGIITYRARRAGR